MSSSAQSSPAGAPATRRMVRLPSEAFQAEPANEAVGYPAPSPTSQPLFTPMNATTHVVCPDAPTKKLQSGTSSLDPTPSGDGSAMADMTPTMALFPRRMSSNCSLDSCPETTEAPETALRLPEQAVQAGNESMPFFPAPSPMSNSMVTPMNHTTHAIEPNAPERRMFGSAGSLPSSLAPTPMADASPMAPSAFGLPLRLPSRVFNDASQGLPAFPAPSPQSSMFTPMNATTHVVCPNAPERPDIRRRAPSSLDPTPESGTSSTPMSVMDPANIWPTSSTSGTPMDGHSWPAPQFQLGSKPDVLALQLGSALGLSAQMFPSQSPKGDALMGDVTPIASASGTSGSLRDLDWLAPILNERTPVDGDDTPMSFMQQQHDAYGDDTPVKTMSNSDLNKAVIMDTPQVTPAGTPMSCMASGADSKKGGSASSSQRTPMDTQPLGFFPNEAMPDNGPSMCFRNSGA